MRLTLRTLLAYLDDTLPPSEIKEIGEKVAESEPAQELIGRIKQVTRRRRLTVPPTTGPGSFEPNDVAEYLDNTLGHDQVSEVEKQCLESDVHLAEIAACHQILTLVLGEAPAVPPKSRERMYGLVKGRESIPYRKAVATRKPSDEAMGEEEQLSLSGGPLKWILPIAAVLLVVALGLAVWSILPERDDGRLAVVPPSRTDKTKADDGGKVADKDKHDDKTKTNDDKSKIDEKEKGKAEPPTPPETDRGKKDAPDKDQGKGKGENPPPPPPVQRRPAASTERAIIANYLGGHELNSPTALISRKSADSGPEAWTAHPANAQLHSDDTLLALPGCTSLIQKGGVSLVLRGSVPDYAMTARQLYILDSAVILHQSKEVDLDLTLLRGRIFLQNRKREGPAKVRLRFGENQVWDITLAEQLNEVGIDLVRIFRPDMGADEEPFAELNLALIRGEATINVNAYDEFNPTAHTPRAVLFRWDNVRGFGFEANTPWRKVEELPPEWWIKPPPTGEFIKRFQAALKGLEVRLSPKGKEVNVALKEGLKEADPIARVLAIYGMAGIDDVGTLVDTLGDEDLTHAIERAQAKFALQHWLSRSLAQGKSLYDDKTKTGFLLTKFKKPSEAKIFHDLLYLLPPDMRNDPETFDLLVKHAQSPRVGIAELAYQQLVFLSRGVKLPPFNAADTQEARNRFADAVLKMIDLKQLPPRAAPPGKDGKEGKDKEKDGKDKGKGGP